MLADSKFAQEAQVGRTIVYNIQGTNFVSPKQISHNLRVEAAVFQNMQSPLRPPLPILLLNTHPLHPTDIKCRNSMKP